MHQATPEDQWCMYLLDSMRPPPMTPASARIAMRERTDTDEFDIETVKREAREAVARQAAEELAKNNAEKLVAIAAAAAVRKAWWMGIAGDVVKWAILGLLAVITGALWSAIKHAP